MSDSRKNKPKMDWPEFLANRVGEGIFILILTGLLFLLLSLMTLHEADPGWFRANKNTSSIYNAGGQAGAYLADALFYLFGYFSFLIPVCLSAVSWFVLKHYKKDLEFHGPECMVRGAGFLFLWLSTCGLLGMDPLSVGGGVSGQLVAGNLIWLLSYSGAALMLSAMFFAGVTWFTGYSWLLITENLGRYVLTSVITIKKYSLRSHAMLMNGIYSFMPDAPASETMEPKESKARSERILPKITPVKLDSPQEIVKEKSPPLLIGKTEEPVTIKVTQPAPTPATKPAVKTATAPKPVQSMPELSLLDKGLPAKPLGGYSHQELETISRELEQHLLDFSIQADVVAVHPGPVITRFELQLAAGIKVSKLTALSKDLARSLSVTSVRVVEVIPGKTVVGLELPNQNREMVRLSNILSAEVYQQGHSPLTMVLGVDIAGYPMVVDLAKMPHLLVAGTTGSGKSVGINTMILSLLFKSTPEQVRLIMVDPKMLELSVYDGIPHLLTPVVTDMKEAASALRWCVAEMEKRYKLMAALGVRNIAGYNTKVIEAREKGTPLLDPLWKLGQGMEEEAPLLETLPYIVVIIDELADMMMVVGKKVEQLIARIAQKARAAGIHLVLATQRPSVDVLTGLIKSNIPTRISFQVSSKIDSRTILDQQGAEQLLGHGDMLYLAPGTGTPLRVHGAFVSDDEVHRIADDWRARGEPNYVESITQTSTDSLDSHDQEEQAVEEADPLFDQAVEFVMQTRKASISAVQRRLKIGYNRAARMIEEMERLGLVGPLDGGYRDVLVSSATED